MILASVLASAAFQARARATARPARAGGNIPWVWYTAVLLAAIGLVAIQAGASIGVSDSVSFLFRFFGVDVALGSRTLVHCYAQDAGSTVAFLMARLRLIALDCV